MSIQRNRERWCEALESGDYAQGKGALQTPAGFCCLGVALDVLQPDGWKAAHAGSKHIAHKYGVGIIHSDYAEPALGLSQDDQAFLGGMNDSGVSFAEIAAEIRRMPVAP